MKDNLILGNPIPFSKLVTNLFKHINTFYNHQLPQNNSKGTREFPIGMYSRFTLNWRI